MNLASLKQAAATMPFESKPNGDGLTMRPLGRHRAAAHDRPRSGHYISYISHHYDSRCVSFPPYRRASIGSEESRETADRINHAGNLYQYACEPGQVTKPRNQVTIHKTPQAKKISAMLKGDVMRLKGEERQRLQLHRGARADAAF
jgi:hypothetical protein